MIINAIVSWMLSLAGLVCSLIPTLPFTWWTVAGYVDPIIKIFAHIDPFFPAADFLILMGILFAWNLIRLGAAAMELFFRF